MNVNLEQKRPPGLSSQTGTAVVKEQSEELEEDSDEDEDDYFDDDGFENEVEDGIDLQAEDGENTITTNSQGLQ